jgi:hypothetical protein
VPEVPVGVTRSDPQGWCGKKAKGDALDVLLLRLLDIRGELADAQAAAERDPYPAALITFRKRTTLAAAAGVHHVAEASTWQLQAAPPPDGLLWSQLGLRGWQVATRRRVLYAGERYFFCFSLELSLKIPSTPGGIPFGGTLLPKPQLKIPSGAVGI